MDGKCDGKTEWRIRGKGREREEETEMIEEERLIWKGEEVGED